MSDYRDVEDPQGSAAGAGASKSLGRGAILLPLLAGLALVILGLIVGFGDFTSSDKGPSDAAARARWLMERHLTIDGHNDLPWQYRKQVKNRVSPSPINLRVEQPEFGLHTDIPKLKQGLLTGQFWSVYIDCGRNDKDAVRTTMEQIDTMDRIISEYPDVFQRALTSGDIEAAFKNKKVASLYGIEGGHQIDSSMAALRMFYDLGVRYMTLTHNCDTPWARWWGSDAENMGLTDWGKALVREMNRVGMFVDLSHVSKEVMVDVLTMDPPVPPVIFSHTSSYTVCPIGRNVQDDVLELVKANGGVVMVNFFPGFINPDWETTETTLDMVVDHIEHMKNVAGIDHVGLGGDYDGVTALPVGLEDVSTYPALVQRMLERGFTDQDVIKVMGGNLMRAMRAMEAYKTAHAGDPVGQEWIDPQTPGIINNTCRTQN